MVYFFDVNGSGILVRDDVNFFYEFLFVVIFINDLLSVLFNIIFWVFENVIV